MAELSIRPGRPTASDAAAFAELADMAAGGLFGSLLGRRALEIVARVYRHPANELSFEQTHFCEEDGSIAGMVNGYFGRHAKELRRGTARWFARHAGWRLIRAAAVALPRARVFAFMDRLAPDAYYIQELAVFPDRRGQGLGRVLLESVEETAREAGAASLELDVETGNDVAIALYEGFGFQAAATSPKALLGNVQVLRMVKHLA